MNPTVDFESTAFDHSAISPHLFCLITYEFQLTENLQRNPPGKCYTKLDPELIRCPEPGERVQQIRYPVTSSGFCEELQTPLQIARHCRRKFLSRQYGIAFERNLSGAGTPGWIHSSDTLSFRGKARQGVSSCCSRKKDISRQSQKGSVHC